MSFFLPLPSLWIFDWMKTSGDWRGIVSQSMPREDEQRALVSQDDW